MKFTKAGAVPYVITTDYAGMRAEAMTKHQARFVTLECEPGADGSRCGLVYEEVLRGVACVAQDKCDKERILALQAAFDSRYTAADAFDVLDRCGARCADPELWERAVLKAHNAAVGDQGEAELAAIDAQEANERGAIAQRVQANQRHLQQGAFAGAMMLNARRTGQPIVVATPLPGAP
jgi:hypothetical protein